MIQVEHLTKCYGDVTALKDVSFEIGEGHVFGLLGPNGAGKSTLMNVMTGCLSATEGRVLIGGHDIYEEPLIAKRMIGYLPELPPLYLQETPMEYLRFVGEAKGLKGKELQDQIETVFQQTGISLMRNRLIGNLSKGYKQRVGIAQALLGNPEVIILDEPTVGLDPIQIIEIRDLIRELGETHTVIFSSHILSEVQSICGQVLIISGGHLVAYDTPENLEQTLAGGTQISFSVQGTESEVHKVLDQLENIGRWTVSWQSEDSVRVELETDGEEEIREINSKLFFAFASEQMPIQEMQTKKATLEDIFLELTEDNNASEDEIGLDEIVQPETVFRTEENPLAETESVSASDEAEKEEVKE